MTEARSYCHVVALQRDGEEQFMVVVREQGGSPFDVPKVYGPMTVDTARTLLVGTLRVTDAEERIACARREGTDPVAKSVD
jgi:hypothetical protein